MSSDDDGSVLMAAFKKGAASKKDLGRSASRQAPSPRKQASFSPGQFISDDESEDADKGASMPTAISVRKAIAVRAAPVRNRSEYTYYEPQDTVENIVREFQKNGNLMYEVKLTNGQTREVSLLCFIRASR